MFAGTVGLAALLLFQVQLVLGKRLLPWYGGTSAAWTTCLLFFQAALLAGYAWAHVLAGRLSPRRQRKAHLALVGAAVALLAWRAFAWPSPIWPGEAPGRAAVDVPILSILGLLSSTIGLPFVALAATSPLLQAWQAQRRPGSSPFWLFALSNAGSLLGLAIYPLVVEPLASTRTQGWLWSSAFVACAVGLAWCARDIPRDSRLPGPDGSAGIASPSGPAPPASLGVTLALAFFPSVMLAAVTSHLTQDVAAVPLLWMLPLALYLLTFILSFSWPDAGRVVWRVAMIGAAGLAVAGLHGALSLGVTARLVLWSAVLFAYGMAGHGELARRRPEPSRLTGYYLGIAAGGALGGLLCAVAAPLLFEGYWELHVGILAGPAVMLAAASTPEDPAAARQLRLAAALAVLVLGVALGVEIVAGGRVVERASRGFYGVLRVVREEPGWPDEHLRLLHGRISHGTQLAAPSRRAELTTYFGPSSGVGLAIRRHPKRLAGGPMRIGVIGLGVGTLAAWSRAGDVVRFYELDPEVARLSAGETPVFTYLRDAAGEVSVALGDGRLTLEREAPQAYDVLVVDAFSSDAIPTHLLTVEAFGAYLRHLAGEGVLALQVTNRYLDLKPVVRGAARALSLRAEHVPSLEKGLLWSSDWMLVAPGPTFFEDEVVSAATLPRLPRADEVLWTDDWSNLLRVVKR
ncbi:MAG TPA: fused MFS/spermidine synthase [Vicinamibacteria bacterium]|nr:fused MFS/spermidine synthase [Vicinamibacteria bacterium]